jgi:hypothetical protein
MGGGGAGPSSEDVERMCRTVEALMNELRETASRIKGTEQFSTTRRTFSDWASDLGALATKVDDVLFEFRFIGQESTGKAAAALKPSGSKKFNIAELVSQMKKDRDSATPTGDDAPVGLSPRANAVTLPSPRRAGGGGGSVTPRSGMPPKPPALAVGGGNATTPRSGTATGRSVDAGTTPRSGQRVPGAAVRQEHDDLIARNPEHGHNVLMASSLHLLLDATVRLSKASSATLFVPVNGNVEHLAAVCDVGRGPDTQLSSLTIKDPSSAPSLAAATGIMVTICRGHDTAAEKPKSATDLYNAASTTFRESVRMAVSPTGDGSRDIDVENFGSSGNSSPRHAIKAPVTAGGFKRSSVWSAVSVPVRQHSSQSAAGVLHVVNKMGGRANFEPEDEVLLYGVAAQLAAFLQRVADPRALIRFYQPIRAMPPVVQQPKIRLSSKGAPALEPHFGIRSQLVWRTWDHPGSVREVKVIAKDKAVKLNERVPVMRVYDYVERLQSSWRESALLNVEYQQAFDQRTAYLTMLVHKLKSAAVKNEALAAMIRDLRRGVAPDLPRDIPAHGSLALSGFASDSVVAPAKLTPRSSRDASIPAAAASSRADRSEDDDDDDDDDDSIAAAQAQRPNFIPPRGAMADDSEESPGSMSMGSLSYGGGGANAMLSSADSDDLIRRVEADEAAADARIAARKASARDANAAIHETRVDPAPDGPGDADEPENDDDDVDSVASTIAPVASAPATGLTLDAEALASEASIV